MYIAFLLFIFFQHKKKEENIVDKHFCLVEKHSLFQFSVWWKNLRLIFDLSSTHQSSSDVTPEY